jgi:hypothetical protein
MTTETPHQPTPPPPVYPTAPPWASPPEAVAQQPAAGPPWGNEPYTRHGQLMVAHPELMNSAARPAAPSWVPTAIFTFVFFPAGIVSAVRRTKKAKQARREQYPYWIAFVGALVIASVLWRLVFAIATPLLMEHVFEPMATKNVQSSIVHGGQLKTPTGTAVKAAACTPSGTRMAASGLRAYSCTVTLDDGETGTLKVTATTGGAWTKVK